jgi:hypothetical protein
VTSQFVALSLLKPTLATNGGVETRSSVMLPLHVPRIVNAGSGRVTTSSVQPCAKISSFAAAATS